MQARNENNADPNVAEREIANRNRPADNQGRSLFRFLLPLLCIAVPVIAIAYDLTPSFGSMNAQLETKLDDTMEKVEMLSNRVEQLNSENEAMSTAAQQNLADDIEREQTQKALEEKIQRIESDNVNLQQQLSEVNEKLKTLDDLKREMTASDEHQRQLSVSLESLTKEFQSQNKEKEMYIAQLEEKVANSTDKLGELSDRVVLLQSEIMTLKSGNEQQLSQLTTSLNVVKSDADKHDTAQDELVEKMKGDKKEFQNKLVETTSKQTVLQQQLSEVTEKLKALDDLKRKMTASDEQQRQLSTSMESLTKEFQLQNKQKAVICPANYQLNPHSRTCLRLIRSNKAWEDAKNYCVTSGEYLATFETLESAFWFIHLRKAHADWRAGHMWIGGKVTDGVWKWRGKTTENIHTIPWGVSQPEHTKAQECLVSWKDDHYKYHDWACGKTTAFACEKLM